MFLVSEYTLRESGDVLPIMLWWTLYLKCFVVNALKLHIFCASLLHFHSLVPKSKYVFPCTPLNKGLGWAVKMGIFNQLYCKDEGRWMDITQLLNQPDRTKTFWTVSMFEFCWFVDQAFHINTSDDPYTYFEILVHINIFKSVVGF